MIAEDDLGLFELASDPQDAWSRLERYVVQRIEPSRSKAL